MEIHFNFELEDQLLVVTTTGLWRSHADSIAMCRTIGEVASHYQSERVLWLDFTSRRPFSILEAHISGEAAADAFRGVAVAYVPRYPLIPEMRQQLDFGVAVAQNRGLRGQVCLEEDVARQWLASLPSDYFALCDW